MKKLVRTLALLLAVVGVFTMCRASFAQPGRGADLPSPGRVADVTLDGGAKIHIDYSAPSLRGRKGAGGLMPYDTWWRTGANEATTFVTTAPVMVGSLQVPAGKYTLVTQPSEGTWQLVICKHTGQWGTERFEADDLGRTPMMRSPMPGPQEQMSITFDKTSGRRTQLHIRWGDTDVWVPVYEM
jgi:hypothetical protein